MECAEMQPKPRNNYSRLPWEIRSRILGLLHNGAEYDDIRRDPQVAAELKNKKLSLHNTTFQAIRRSEEYQSYVERATEDSAAKKAEAITRAVLENNDALGSVTDIARYELAKLIREEVKATSGDEDSVKRIRSLAASLAAVSNPAREAEWRKKLDRANAEIEELKAEIAGLNVELETMKAGTDKKPEQAGISPETLAKVEQKIRML